MDGKITMKYLQNYIKSKHHSPELKQLYFIKLVEEVGELARAIHKDLPANSSDGIKETIDEEIWDVIYMALALANCYDIDIESVIPKKEALSNQKYNHDIVFEENR